jgi:hypothetical protein
MRFDMLDSGKCLNFMVGGAGIKPVTPTMQGYGCYRSRASHMLPNNDFWEAVGRERRANLPKTMARPTGFEPMTPRFVVWCSIQLSYGR